MRRREARFEAALAPHLGRPAPEDAPLVGVEAARTIISPLRRAQLGFGYDAVRADHYPIAWWLVLPLALAGARFAAGLAAPMVRRPRLARDTGAVGRCSPAASGASSTTGGATRCSASSPTRSA